MQIMRHLKQQGPSERLILRCHWKHCVYLASRNFLSLLGRSWFLRCLNHLWTCRTGKPVCLLKLSTEHWRQKQDKDKRVSEVCHLKWQTTADRGSQAMWMAGCVCVFFFKQFSSFHTSAVLSSVIRASAVSFPGDTLRLCGPAGFLK